MGEQSIVPDTSLLLYLGRIGKVDVLPLLYKEVCVPEKVVQELDVGRLLRGDTIDPRALDWVTVVPVSQKGRIQQEEVATFVGWSNMG